MYCTLKRMGKESCVRGLGAFYFLLIRKHRTRRCLCQLQKKALSFGVFPAAEWFYGEAAPEGDLNDPARANTWYFFSSSFFSSDLCQTSDTQIAACTFVFFLLLLLLLLSGWLCCISIGLLFRGFIFLCVLQ